MDEKKRKWNILLKKICILIFLLLLFIPGVFNVIQAYFGLALDVKLLGYNDNVEKPEFSIETFLSGTYQTGYTSWFDAALLPRGIFTKTYTSLRYHLFNLGNRPIGSEGVVFEESYINSELCINGAQDMSVEHNQKAMKEYVQRLELLNQKLKKHGKYLLFYMPSNKASFFRESIPSKYTAMASETAIKPTDYFDKLMKESTVPYLNTDEIGYNLEYPAFYSTGIHWSRPFEQEVSQRIISEISTIADKNYRNLVFGEMQESETPFWRDTDVYDLLNVWNKNEQKYYEYTVQKQYPDKYDKMRILLHGTSFADGLRHDILGSYSGEEIYYVNRNDFLRNPDGTYNIFKGVWDSIDWEYYLDNVDIVILETIAPELTNYSHGFVDCLLQTLEEYVPAEDHSSTMQALDGESSSEWDYNFMDGFYHREVNFAWVKDYCQVTLSDDMLTEKGLQIDFGVSGYLFHTTDKQNVYVYFDGEKVYHGEYDVPWVGSVVISSDLLQKAESENENHRIEIICSDTFNPAEMGLSVDNRDLALHVSYIGRAK